MADNFIADFMGELNQDLNQIEKENGAQNIQNQNVNPFLPIITDLTNAT